MHSIFKITWRSVFKRKGSKCTSLLKPAKLRSWPKIIVIHTRIFKIVDWMKRWKVSQYNRINIVHFKLLDCNIAYSWRSPKETHCSINLNKRNTATGGLHNNYIRNNELINTNPSRIPDSTGPWAKCRCQEGPWNGHAYFIFKKIIIANQTHDHWLCRRPYAKHVARAHMHRYKIS